MRASARARRSFSSTMSTTIGCRFVAERSNAMAPSWSARSVARSSTSTSAAGTAPSVFSSTQRGKYDEE